MESMNDHYNQSEEEDQTSDENNQLEKLEEDVKLMAQKISEFRQILPDQLHNTLASILSAHRPTLYFNHSVNQPLPSTIHNSENVTSEDADPTHIEKIQTIKQKITSNASAMSSVSKRMKDCMSRIDKLDSVNKDIHPAFKRRKITSENCLL